MRKINEYLTIKGASELLGVSRTTLRNWNRSGKLKAYRNKNNNYRLYRVEDLKQFLLETEEIK